MATRPTSDRLRETLFNVLGPRLPGARFLDLYAGSGAVGIEALSRGAAFCCFVERAPAAIAAIRSNLQALKLTTGFTIEARPVATMLEDLSRQPDGFDLVFLDPPYDAASAYTSTLATLGSQPARLLSPNALVIAEHARRVQLSDRFGALERYRLLEQGDAALSFYAAATTA